MHIVDFAGNAGKTNKQTNKKLKKDVLLTSINSESLLSDVLFPLSSVHFVCVCVFCNQTEILKLLLPIPLSVERPLYKN